MLLAQIKATYSSGAESSTEHSDSEQEDAKPNKKVKNESEENGEDGKTSSPLIHWLLCADTVVGATGQEIGLLFSNSCEERSDCQIIISLFR